MTLRCQHGHGKRQKIQQHKSISITQAYDWHGNDDENDDEHDNGMVNSNDNKHGNGMKQAWYINGWLWKMDKSVT